MIKGDKINLLALERQDILTSYIWANDFSIIEKAGITPVPLGIDDIEKWYDFVKNSQNIIVFAIKDKENNHLGNIELSQIDYRNLNAELGIIIGNKDMLNKGIGKEAISLMVDFAFKQLNLFKIYVRVLENNDIALKIFQDLGFEKEGVHKKEFYINGKYLDVIYMAKFRNF